MVLAYKPIVLITSVKSVVVEALGLACVTEDSGSTLSPLSFFQRRGSMANPIKFFTSVTQGVRVYKLSCAWYDSYI